MEQQSSSENRTAVLVLKSELIVLLAPKIAHAVLFLVMNNNYAGSLNSVTKSQKTSSMKTEWRWSNVRYMDRPAPVTDCCIHLLDQRSRPCISAAGTLLEGWSPVRFRCLWSMQHHCPYCRQAPLSSLSSGTIVLTVVRHHCPHCRQAPLSSLSSGTIVLTVVRHHCPHCRQAPLSSLSLGTIVLTVVRHHCPHCRQAPLSLLSSGTIVLTVVRHHCPHCRQAPLSLLSSGGAPSCGCWDTIRTGKDPPLKAHGIFHSVLSQPRARPLPPLPPPPPQSGSYLPPSGHSEGWSHTYQREFSLTAGIFRCMARHAVTALS